MNVPILLARQAFTLEPYRNAFKNQVGRDSPSTIAATPIIRIPVPKKKDYAIDKPKYLLKITFKKV